MTVAVIAFINGKQSELVQLLLCGQLLLIHSATEDNKSDQSVVVTNPCSCSTEVGITAAVILLVYMPGCYGDHCDVNVLVEVRVLATSGSENLGNNNIVVL